MGAPKATKYTKKAIFGIIGMLVFGTGTMISSKLMLDTSACPMYNAATYPGYEKWDHGACPPEFIKKFEKPWFQTALMFAAMFMCLFGHFITAKLAANKRLRMLAARNAEQRVEKSRSNSDSAEVPQPADPKKAAEELAEEPPKPSIRTWAFWKPWVLIAVPSVFDMIATSVMTMGLVYIDVSVMQMLRGTMVIFCSIMNVLFLRRRVRLYQWIAILCTAVACTLVGLSCILSSMNSTTAKPWHLQLFGCVLVVISQLVQSGQIVVEDFLLSDVNAAPLQVVGMEGFWGFLITVLFVFPLLKWGVAGEDNGSNEDFFDTFYMIADNTLIIAFCVVYFVSILFLNWAGMVVTSEMSSVVRTIFEAVRTAAIWVADLFIFYVVAPNMIYGESWTTYSWLQLAGFLLLIFSSQMYNGYCKYPRLFKYKFDDDGTTLGVFKFCPHKVGRDKNNRPLDEAKTLLDAEESSVGHSDAKGDAGPALRATATTKARAARAEVRPEVVAKPTDSSSS